MKRLFMLIVTSSFLSGCSSFLGLGEDNFACSGLPEGAKCLSAMDVLKATDYKDYISSDDVTYFKDKKKAKGILFKDEAQSSTDDGPRRRRFGDEADAQKPASNNISQQQLLRSAAPAPDRNIPIRTQPVILRIWLAPWEDDQGFLNMAGYTYTEMVPRQWAVGEPYQKDGFRSLTFSRQDPVREKKVKKAPIPQVP